MPYMSRKRMTLNGKAYAPGELIPPGVVEIINPSRFQSLQRLRYIEEVTAGQARTAVKEGNRPKEVQAPEGESCDVCGGGPFKNLAAHMSKKHKPQEE